MTSIPKVSRLTEFSLMMVLGAIWGGSFLFMRMASKEFGPIALIQFRVFVASLFLSSVVLVQGRGRELLSHPVRMSIVGLSGSAVPFTLFAFGTLTLSAGLASVLNATSPFFGALIAVFYFREPLSRAKWLGLMVAFSGVCLLVSDKLQIQGGVLAVVACLIAALCYGISAHYSKKKLGDLSPLVVAAGSQIASTLWMLPLSIWFLPTETPSWQSWIAAATLGVVCTGVALVIYFYLIRAIEATRAMTIAYLIPLFGILWGAIFLHETLTYPAMAGGGFVLLGLYWFNRR
ncbi:DMT family transporter [Pirellulaceae bacterium SH449]